MSVEDMIEALHLCARTRRHQRQPNSDPQSIPRRRKAVEYVRRHCILSHVLYVCAEALSGRSGIDGDLNRDLLEEIFIASAQRDPIAVSL